MVCIRCQKRPAIIFIQRMDNGQMKQEGYCLHCARELHIKPVDDLMKQFGMSDQDLDNMENRMESMMEEMGDANPLSMMMNMANGGEDADPDSMDEDLIPGSNATFPLGFTSSEKKDGDKKADRKNGKKPPKRKFLDTYCENLTRKAREGKLDDIIGRDREIYRTIQILSRRQKNNPCLIGEAGVGKTAIAEGIAERIAKGNVPIGLQDKEIYLLDLTSLVAGTQFRVSSQNIILFKFYAQIDIKLLLRMRCTFHIHTTLISNSFYCNQNIIAIWSHNFNCLAYTEFITLFYMIKSLCILFADNAKICVLTNVGIVIVDLSLMGRFAIEESCRILAIGTL